MSKSKLEFETHPLKGKLTVHVSDSKAFQRPLDGFPEAGDIVDDDHLLWPVCGHGGFPGAESRALGYGVLLKSGWYETALTGLPEERAEAVPKNLLSSRRQPCLGKV